MKYGCIGERLGHSFSAEVHSALTDYEYELCEIESPRLDAFMAKRDFAAINVTIPYKERVIPHLTHIDEHARAIGAVNTVVNRDGELYGYNTDFSGLESLIRHAGVDPKGKKVLILGTGGTSKTAFAVCSALDASEIVTVSRYKGEDRIDYGEMYRLHKDADIIINTTPVGMFPDCGSSPVDLSKFLCLSGVIDAVYNPLRTALVSEARALGIPAEGGLYMLVAQGVRASEIFTGQDYHEGELDRVYTEILSSKENIVLSGMPSSGKSTVGRLIADLTGRNFLDTDALVEEDMGMKISEIFKNHGEGVFREAEAQAIRKASSHTGLVIATGGGAVLHRGNVAALKQNGRIYFLDRSPAKLCPTPDRPLALSREQIEARYKERYQVYLNTADEKIEADGTPSKVAEEIIRKHGVKGK